MDEKRTIFEETEDKYDKVLNLLELYNLVRFGYGYIICLLSYFPKRKSLCLNRLELAKLIQFFESCYGNKNCDISLNGIVNTPREGEVKGSNLKCSITDNRMLLKLLEYLHTLLDNEQDGLYNYIFDWNEKEKIKYIHGLGPEYQYTEDSFFKEPYSDHELNKIISYEEYCRKKTELKPNLLIGQRLTFMNKKFIDKGMFTNNKGEITKEYSLLYDYLVINGQVNKIGELGEYKGDNANLKYHKVRDWMNAYSKYKKKNQLKEESDKKIIGYKFQKSIKTIISNALK